MRKILFVICAFFTFNTFAKIDVDIVGGKLDPIPIAIQPFEAEASLAKIANDLYTVIGNDLTYSGMFKIIDPEAFINRTDKVGALPTFNDWKIINANILVQAKITKKDLTNMRIEFYIWDVVEGKQVHAEALVSLNSNWRRMAHIMADTIYKALTGDSGYFDSRVVYVSEYGDRTHRIKRLAIMDWDGENHKFLTDEKTLVLTPRFAPNMQKIAFLSYFKEVPKVYTFDLQTGAQDSLGDFPGMTFAPRFSPDGTKMLLSQEMNGNSDIYEVNLATKEKKRLTNHPAIDTSPCYSPDGKKIVFNSDRDGPPSIYTMNADGSDVKRITFNAGKYFTPVWSPRGDLIAFTKIQGGQFYIGVVFPDGDAERTLVKSNDVIEGPSWAPNGRRILYFKEELINKGKEVRTRIYSIDLTGYHQFEVKTPKDASDPAWSPLLK